MAVVRDQEGEKLCFGRIEFCSDEEKNRDETVLDYGHFKLLRTFISVDEATSMARGLTQGNARLGQIDLPVKGNLSPPPIRYVASQQPFGAICPLWASTLYYFQIDGGLAGYPPTQPLVRVNLPTYLSGNEAVTEFCELRGGFSQGQLIFVVPDLRARINRLRIQEGKLSVDVEPRIEKAENLRVKFYAQCEGKPTCSSDLTLESGRAEFMFKGTLTYAMAHLILTSTGEDIDNRVFAPYYSREDIVVEASELRVKELVTAGEGLRVEFKEDLPPDEHRFLDSMIAFANTSGGTILIGVSDDCEIKGIKQNPQQVLETITNWVSEKCDPRPSYTTNQLEVDGKTIIIVDVATGSTKPYHHLDRGFLVRRGASNRQARRSEVEEMFHGHQVARFG